jgi:rRNA-processing protein CGR1
MTSNMERYTTSSLPGPSSAEVVTNPAPRPIAASNGGRSIGKAHKSPKEALKRSYISPSLKTPFEKRKEKEKAQEAVKAVEQEMKEDEEAKKLRLVILP